MKKLSKWALGCAILGLLLLVVSGPGTRLDLWNFAVGLLALVFGYLLMVVASLLAIIELFRDRFAGPGLKRNGLISAVGLLLTSYLIFGILAGIGSSAPIHDITTDTSDPPVFVTLLAERADSPNSADYAGEEVASLQREYYPDIEPLILNQTWNNVFDEALDLVEGRGWSLSHADRQTGRIEATDTTSWMGFKDDVVIRLRRVEGGVRVDMRSLSRVGQGDLGVNAARIRDFLDDLQ